MNTFLSTKIELWPVEKLIAYDRNARTHSDEQIEQIARSIQEFGFTNPILVDTGAGILAGLAELVAARPTNCSYSSFPRAATTLNRGQHCPDASPAARANHASFSRRRWNGGGSNGSFPATEILPLRILRGT